MADYSNSKVSRRNAYPVEFSDGASGKRVESIITPAQLISRFFTNISLVSPVTRQAPTEEQIQDNIDQAIPLVEQEIMIDIFPVQRDKRIPFRVEDYQNYILIELPNKPITSIDDLSIESSNYQKIYTIPADWIETGSLIQGKVNVIPLTPASAGSSQGLILSTGSTIGAFFLFLGAYSYLPAYWTVKYTAGFKNGMVPMNINRLIGLKAAMQMLTPIISQFPFSSHSLGLDGASQSQANQAAALFQKMFDLYKAEYDELSKQIKNLYNNGIIAYNI